MARFEKLVVWQRAQQLAIAVRRVASRLRYDAADQLRRSTASIADNIAEGADRETDTEFARFLAIAAGSCAEAQSQLRRAHCLGFDCASLIREAQEIGWMIGGLRRSLTAAPAPG